MSNSNIHKRLSQEQPGTLHVGVDLAWKKNDVVVIDEQARRCDRFGFQQDVQGYAYMLGRLEKLREKQGAAQIVIAMEPTNFFWKLLANYLEEKKVPYRLVNAYTVNRHREGNQLDRSKDDQRDAFTIAELSRTGKYTSTQLQRDEYAELRGYSTLYRQLKRDIAREKAILWGLVGQVFPELRQAFKEPTGVTIDALLKACPAAATIRSLPLEAFLEQVEAATTNKRLNYKKLRLAHQLAQTSIGLTDGISAISFAICLHLGYLETLQHDMLTLIRAMKTCLEQIEVAAFV